MLAYWQSSRLGCTLRVSSRFTCYLRENKAIRSSMARKWSAIYEDNNERCNQAYSLADNCGARYTQLQTFAFWQLTGFHRCIRLMWYKNRNYNQRSGCLTRQSSISSKVDKIDNQFILRLLSRKIARIRRECNSERQVVCLVCVGFLTPSFVTCGAITKRVRSYSKFCAVHTSTHPTNQLGFCDLTKSRDLVEGIAAGGSKFKLTG